MKKLMFLCCVLISAAMILSVSAESGKLTIQSMTVAKEGYEGAVETYTDANGTYELAKAYDGDMATRTSVSCAANTAWGALSDASPLYFTVDLGASYTIESIAISWLTSGNNRAYKYTVSASDNGNTYTTIIDRAGENWQTNNIGTKEGTVNTVTDSVSDKTGRYLKISVYGVSENVFTAIYEIDITGSAAQNNPETQPDNPQTGDPVSILAFSVLCAVTSIIRKRK